MIIADIAVIHDPEPAADGRIKQTLTNKSFLFSFCALIPSLVKSIPSCDSHSQSHQPPAQMAADATGAMPQTRAVKSQPALIPKISQCRDAENKHRT